MTCPAVRFALVPIALAALFCVPGCLSASPARLPRSVPAGHTGEFTTWWAEARKKEVGEYLHGKKHGDVTSYRQDGSVAYIGTFEHDVPTGVVEHFHPDGSLERTEVYRDGILDGPRVEFYPGGAPFLETQWVAGRRDGAESQWYQDGSQAVESHWTAGQRTGHWRQWSPSGVLVKEEYYWVVDGAEVGYLETIYEANGHVSVQTLTSQRGGVWSGWVSLWHDNGRQASLVEYTGGKRNGREVNWSPVGRKLSEGTRRDDLRDGLWTFYDGEGRAERTVRYEAGRPLPDDVPVGVGEAPGEAAAPD